MEIKEYIQVAVKSVDASAVVDSEIQTAAFLAVEERAQGAEDGLFLILLLGIGRGEEE